MRANIYRAYLHADFACIDGARLLKSWGRSTCSGEGGERGELTIVTSSLASDSDFSVSAMSAMSEERAHRTIWGGSVRVPFTCLCKHVPCVIEMIHEEVKKFRRTNSKAPGAHCGLPAFVEWAWQRPLAVGTVVIRRTRFTTCLLLSSFARQQDMTA